MCVFLFAFFSLFHQIKAVNQSFHRHDLQAYWYHCSPAILGRSSTEVETARVARAAATEKAAARANDRKAMAATKATQRADQKAMQAADRAAKKADKAAARDAAKAVKAKAKEDTSSKAKMPGGK